MREGKKGEKERVTEAREAPLLGVLRKKQRGKRKKKEGKGKRNERERKSRK